MVCYRLILLLMLAAPLFSCSLNQPDLPRVMSGIVLDKETGKPLNGVKISIEIKKKGRSGIGPEGLHAPKVWATPSQLTGDVDSQAWDFRENGTFSFDLTPYYRDINYKYLTVSQLTAEKSGYQTITMEYPPKEQTIFLSRH